MSRIGKKPITLVSGTLLTVSGNTVKVKGPLGELSRDFRPDIGIAVSENTVTLSVAKQTPQAPALWGTYASHISNMIKGVNKAYEKRLVIEGIGFKVDVKGTDMVLSLGFSHPVKVSIPKGLAVKVEKGVITISGIDKELVGQFAASIRSLKKPEPYKGKGIRYENEVIRRKEGKKAA
jgi:large subunit ribosomal protein L6